MNTLIVRVVVALSMVAGILAAAVPSAHATHHSIKIREVFANADNASGVQYIELQMFAAAMGSVSGHRVRVYNSSGLPVANGTFEFSSNLANADNQDYILLATTPAAGYFGVVPDVTMGSAVIPSAGGKVCYEDGITQAAIDCVAWGNYDGPAPNPESDVGAPFNQAGGIPTGSSILRQVGTNGTLEAADDTNSSAADFALSSTPTPTNFAGVDGNPGGTLKFGSSSYIVNEADGSRTLVATRTGGTGYAVSVTYQTVDGSAKAGSDYVSKSGSITLPSGVVTASFGIEIVDDAENENDEEFSVRLSNPTNRAVLGSPTTSNVTIFSDEGASELSFSATEYTAYEGTMASILVTRGGNTSHEVVTVDFATSDGSATSADYTSVTQTLVFDSPEQTGVFVDIPLADDAETEGPESIILTLSNPQSDPEGNAVLVSPATATLRILDPSFDETKPRSNILRPDHNTTHRQSRLGSFTGTASDAGTGVGRVQIALRRTMTNGTCKWWTGSGWRKASCASKLWRNAKGAVNWSYSLSRNLPKSVGTTTRYFHLFSRAIDQADPVNIESAFTSGRNANRFEIR